VVATVVQAPPSTLRWSSYAPIALVASVAAPQPVLVGTLELLIAAPVRTPVDGGCAVGVSVSTTTRAVAVCWLPCSSPTTVTL
jgi:hypothetical protein